MSASSDVDDLRQECEVLRCLSAEVIEDARRTVEESRRIRAAARACLAAMKRQGDAAPAQTHRERGQPGA